MQSLIKSSPRGVTFEKLFLPTMAAAMLSCCAPVPHSIPPAQVSTAHLAAMTCSELKDLLRGEEERVIRLAASQHDSRTRAGAANLILPGTGAILPNFAWEIGTSKGRITALKTELALHCAGDRDRGTPSTAELEEIIRDAMRRARQAQVKS